jgi:phosphoribosylformylglycinamidine synthase
VHNRRIEIAVKPQLEDPFAHHIKWEIESTLGFTLRSLRVVSVYTVYSDLSGEELGSFARDVLCDPVLSLYSVDTPIGTQLSRFTWAAEVSFRSGVTDNVGHTASDVLTLMTGKRDRGFRVYKSTQYLIDADIKVTQVQKIGSEVLFNDLIEEIGIMSYRDYCRKKGFPARGTGRHGNFTPEARTINLNIPDRELELLSNERVLALTLDEMVYFRSYFKRDEIRNARGSVGLSSHPTDVELESFAQTQSEHCKHKIFNATIHYRDGWEERTVRSIFQTYIKSATDRISREKKFLVSVFSDNAGVVQFNDDYNLAFKVETHNSPSALDPYGGSITGIVGCDRDPAGTGLGSRLIAHTDVLCFGDPTTTDALPPRMMHPKRIMEGVIKGIEDGGNKCGIPTINGGVVFDRSYSGKPLVFCGSVGIMPKSIGGVPAHKGRARPGDVIVMIGGRIGKDGIHGATFSSEEISETSPVQAVQIGDPITQKNMLDMLLEARDRLLYRAITDNGAGGLSSSVGEMAQLAGGAYLELEKAPLKYPGLEPWEILLSEAQERMTLAVAPENIDALLNLARIRDVLAVPIGKFTDSGYFHIAHRGKTVGYLELDFLHSTMPLSLEAEWQIPDIREKPPVVHDSLETVLLQMIADLNVCSREPIIRRYDHEVGGKTVVKPLVGTNETGPSDGGVIAPVPGDYRGFVLSAGINPFYSPIDTYHMAAMAVDEALRNAVAVGADPDRVALLDNFCWPDPVFDEQKTPDGKYKLSQLVRAAEGLFDTAVAYGTPFISGKDSMKNDALGIVPDIRKCVTSDFKCDGDSIWLLGKTGSHHGGSLFYRKYGGSSPRVPEVDAGVNLSIYRLYHSLLKEGLISSGHDLSEGGLAIALMESCIGGGLGAAVDLELLHSFRELTIEDVLFSESAGRFLISVDPAVEDEFISCTREFPIVLLGKTTTNPVLSIRDGRERIASLSLANITRAYRAALYRLLGMEIG